jgi:hypothetical protein
MNHQEEDQVVRGLQKLYICINMLEKDREISPLQKERGGCTDEILITSRNSGLTPWNHIRNTGLKHLTILLKTACK